MFRFPLLQGEGAGYPRRYNDRQSVVGICEPVFVDDKCDVLDCAEEVSPLDRKQSAEKESNSEKKSDSAKGSNPKTPMGHKPKP